MPASSIEQPHLSVVSSSHARLLGDVSYHNVMALLVHGERLIRQVGDDTSWTVDCGELQSADSSFVAALLHWLRACKRQNIRFCVTQLPANVRSMITVSGLEEVLSDMVS